MSQVAVLLLFTLLWPLLVGELSAFNLLVGGALTALLLSVLRSGGRAFTRRSWGFVRYAAAFVGELVVANVVIALLALRPRPRLHPHVIAVPLRLRSNAGIALLGATITLLPGTVAMGVSADRTRLYAHAVNTLTPQAAKESVTRMETHILRFMR